MELCKASKLLNDSAVSRFLSRKWIEVNDLSGSQYFVNKNVRFKNSYAKIRFVHYSAIKVSYIVRKGEITVKGDNNAIRRNRKRTFKDNALFKSCLSKINNTFLDNARRSWYCYAQF